MISINTTWNIVNFRSGLVQALVDNGFDVVALAPPDRFVEKLENMGVRFCALPVDNKGTNPFSDAGLLLRYLKLLRRERPCAFLGFTIKPNIYGSLAAHLLGIPVINNVSGLGTAFSANGPLRYVVETLYSVAFRRSQRVFFQNGEDQAVFTHKGLVNSERTILLPGSGVDLDRFAPLPLPEHTTAPVKFLLFGRLLYDKGVVEFIEAARMLRAEKEPTNFAILGFADVDNPRAIPRAVIDKWCAEGVVEYLGTSDDVRPTIEAADCVVLPSYYPEGTPRSLLEAAALARPVITTDMAGCRRTVDAGVTGLFCRPRDAADLAKCMRQIIAMSPIARREMGLAGRRKIEREFDERLVIHSYLEALNECLVSASPFPP